MCGWILLTFWPWIMAQLLFLQCFCQILSSCEYLDNVLVFIVLYMVLVMSSFFVANLLALVLIAVPIIFAVAVMFKFDWLDMRYVVCIMHVLFLIPRLYDDDENYEKITYKRIEPFFSLYRIISFAFQQP